MTDPIKSLVADPRSLAGVRSQSQSQDLAGLKAAARQFESLLTKMMLKSMREANKTVGDDLFGSSQQDMYQDMFDDQLALQMAGGRGLGLADLLVQQLSRSALSAPASSENPAATLSPNVAPTRAPRASSEPTAKQDFVRSMLPLAREAGQQLGVDPLALVAQAALETGWGKAVPETSAGDSSFNLFGIKAGASWSGGSVNVPTLEFDAGLPVRKVERFRSYESAAASFQDYAGMIRKSPRYAAAVGTGSDVAAFASALQQGGYATDPNYAQKVSAVASEVRSIAAAGAFESADPFKSAGNGPLQRLEGKSS
jgi:flagellar protein FlgJ